MHRICHAGFQGREAVAAVAILHPAIVQIVIQCRLARHVAVRRCHEGVIERHPLPTGRIIRALRQKLVIGGWQVRINLLQLSKHFGHDGGFVTNVVRSCIQMLRRGIGHGYDRGDDRPGPRVVEIHVFRQHNVADPPGRARIPPYFWNRKHGPPVKNHRNIGQILCFLLKTIKLRPKCCAQLPVRAQNALHFLRRTGQNDVLSAPAHLPIQHESRYTVLLRDKSLNFGIFLDDNAAIKQRCFPDAKQPHVIRHPGLINGVQKILVQNLQEAEERVSVGAAAVGQPADAVQYVNGFI